mgnify:CR=1 FL=1
MIKLSWSQRCTLQLCHRAYKYKYIDNIVPRSFNKALNFGSVFHELVATLYTKGLGEALKSIDASLAKVDTSSFQQDDFDELQWQTIVLNSMVLAISESYLAGDIADGFKVIEAEKSHIAKPITTATGRKIKGFIYECIPDLVIRDKDSFLWLVEYKTTSKIGQSYFERLQIDEQTNGMIYFLEKEYGEKFKGIIFRVIKKPGIRQTKKETSVQFFDRLQDVMTSRYGDYFFEQIFLRDEALIKEFEVNLEQTCKALRYIIKQELYYKDTSKCSLHKCGYLPLCCNQSGAEMLFEEKKAREEETSEQHF